VALRPNKKASGHWNNEAEPLQVRVDVPNRWSAEPVHQSIPNAPLAVSEETRALEFEVAAPTDAPAGSTPIPAYALYNVCTGPTGACLYRRQDFNVQIKIIGPQP
jgi:hypothetical protein